MDLYVTYVFLLNLVILALVTGEQQVGCDFDEGRLSRVIITSRRNETKHRVILVELDQDVGPAAEDNQEVTLSITHGSTMCNGRERVQLLTSITGQENSPKPRSSEYELFPGVGYYKLHTSGLTWDEARAKCISEDAQLLVINSDAEANVVKKFFSRKPTFKNVNDPLYGAYVGLNDVAAEGKFITIKGEPIESTGYTRWEQGEPKNDKNQNYVGVEKNALLHDIVNGRRMAFFCEKEL